TTHYEVGLDNSIHMPSSHKAGFTISTKGKWLFGADVSLSDWSEFERSYSYRQGGMTRELSNSLGFAAGMQFIPDPTSVSSYFKLVNYRAGFSHRKMPLTINGKDI